MKKWHINIQRELEAPANVFVEQEEEPTWEQCELLFAEAGYEDNWDTTGRVIINEIFKEQK